ncbi:MAG: TetR/AcrR family transcriptional regulator [Coriobacteriaceae bacterium]|nr:TetR/AcrR family transcriptional regulator [Coriobacteriaceae bacterium]
MPQTDLKCDRRSLRSQRALTDAFAAQLADGEDPARITVGDLTDRAGLTRRTFYSHYRDIPDFVRAVEDALIADIRELLIGLSGATLPEVYDSIRDLDPAPGSVELLRYFVDNRDLVSGLMGPSGDPAFIKRIVDMVRDAVSERMQTGIFPVALGPFFDYYVSYVVSAETGVVQRWLENGLVESPETMARIMTVIAFVRPGDLYGMPIDINVPAYGMKLMSMNIDANEGN